MNLLLSTVFLLYYGYVSSIIIIFVDVALFNLLDNKNQNNNKYSFSQVCDNYNKE